MRLGYSISLFMDHNPLETLLQKYPNIEDDPKLYELAWVGDKLLGFAVTRVLSKTKYPLSQLSVVLSEVVSNKHLSDSFAHGLKNGNNVHKRGTVVEAALLMACEKEGIKPVLQVAAYLIAYSPRYKALISGKWEEEVLNKNVTVTEYPIHHVVPDGEKIVENTPSPRPVIRLPPKPSPYKPPVILKDPPPFKRHIERGGHIVGYESLDGQEIMYGKQYRMLCGWPG